ncbi:MAG: alpha/beta hydrolase-fold protein, partial [Caulobacter sp.]
MKRTLLLLCATMLVATQAVAAQPETTTASANGHVMPETEWWDLTAKDGSVYRIYISRPQGEAPKDGYPVLYVLDGNAMFGGFADARRIQSVYAGGADKMIIVGIGYPGGKLYEGRRVGDFTPPIKNAALAQYHAKDPQGGRDRFADFLLDKVRPEVARRYPVNTARQSLFGHSLGGLFALHVLYSRPEAFHTIIATSAALWWDDQLILQEEDAFRAKLAAGKGAIRPARLLLTVGENEEMPVMVTENRQLAGRLEELSRYGLRSEFMLLDDEGHLT